MCISVPTQHLQGGFHFLRRMRPTALFRVGKWENGLIKYMLEKKKIRLRGWCLGWECFSGLQEKKNKMIFFFIIIFGPKDVMPRTPPLIQFSRSNKYFINISLKVQFSSWLVTSYWYIYIAILFQSFWQNYAMLLCLDTRRVGCVWSPITTDWGEGSHF